MLKICFDGTSIAVKEDDTVIPPDYKEAISTCKNDGDFIGEMLLRAVARANSNTFSDGANF